MSSERMGVAGTEVNTADDNDGNWRRYGLRDQKGTEDSQDGTTLMLLGK